MLFFFPCTYTMFQYLQYTFDALQLTVITLQYIEGVFAAQVSEKAKQLLILLKTLSSVLFFPPQKPLCWR